MGMNNTTQLETLAAELIQQLTQRKQSVAVAESCTGGLLGAALTAIPGSSAVVQGGVIAYANEIKQNLLGVPTDLITRFGAVSEEVALSMATQVRTRCNATWGLATTGIAGPSGGSPEKPVGMVWVAIAGPQDSKAVCKIFQGDRNEIRMATVQYIVNAVLSSMRTQKYTCSFEQ